MHPVHANYKAYTENSKPLFYWYFYNQNVLYISIHPYMVLQPLPGLELLIRRFHSSLFSALLLPSSYPQQL